MPIRFTCPNCQTVYTVGDRDVGKKADCKVCGQRLQVPAQARTKTVLGELLPPNRGLAGAPAEAGHTARWSGADPEPVPPGISPTVHATGPIRFDCPACGTGYTVNRASAGRTINCRACGRSMVVPGAPTTAPAPRPSPAPLPAARYVEDDYGPEPEEPEYAPRPAVPSYLTPRPFTGALNGPANRIVAGFGTSLLFIALFLPMFTGPFGFWMSFFDVPWKAVTVGFAVVDEVKERQLASEVAPPKYGGNEVRSDSANPPKGAVQVLLASVASVLYPIFVIAMVAFLTFQIASGRTARGYFVAGIMTGAATVAYAIAIILLNTVPELRLVLLMVSPGFGWAVLFVGCVTLIVAGAIRFNR